MLKLQRSPTELQNPALREVPRGRGQSNAEYVAAHCAKRRANETDLILLGGTGPVDFRLRIAQAHARDDLTPSSWSHVAILGARPGSSGKSGKKASPSPRALYEISLSGRARVGYPPATNGVQQSTLADYDDPALYPNIAVLHVPIAYASVEPIIQSFRYQRTVMDALELKLTWWAFVWGVGRPANPLFDDMGIPGAAFAEYVTSAAGYDLVPGFPTRSSCPEAIWQASRWWHEHPRATAPDVADAGALLPAVSGVYTVEHTLVPPSGDVTRASVPRSRARSRRTSPA